MRSRVRSARQRRFSLLFIDLDRFKHINDSQGHDVATSAARRGNRLDEQLRADDFVARLGGDDLPSS